MDELLPHMSIDPARPGVIIFDGIPLGGMLAGLRAPLIADACNSYQRYREALQKIAKGYPCEIAEDMRRVACEALGSN